VHAHFAALAAANALGAGRLVGVPVSFIGHGHELFVTPRALPQKLAAAAFAAGPCDYTTRYLRQLAPNGVEGRVKTIVMGVDVSRFQRRRPYPGGRTVVAVGRLVEKKGFDVLIDAVAELEGTQPIERLRIGGEGPLRPALEERIAAAGLSGRVELLGALDGTQVRALLEGADLVAVPCVIASNGDRDAMPVVAKEALAMEVPVVASDEVGLPEVVGDGWGRLVPPADPVALAGAISEVLALPAAERAAMGAAGRAFVLESFSLDAEAERLSELITAGRQDVEPA
jgi:glycosyltransferase involved in cell wall biosynthesis